MTLLAGHSSALDIPKYNSDRQDDQNPWGWTVFIEVTYCSGPHLESCDFRWGKQMVHSHGVFGHWNSLVSWCFYVCFAFRIMSYSPPHLGFLHYHQAHADRIISLYVLCWFLGGSWFIIWLHWDLQRKHSQHWQTSNILSLFKYVMFKILLASCFCDRYTF